MWQRSVMVLGLCVGTSVIAFVLYAVDKAAAQRGSRRVAENTLHLWGHPWWMARRVRGPAGVSS